jgi:hypothetical protein
MDKYDEANKILYVYENLNDHEEYRNFVANLKKNSNSDIKFINKVDENTFESKNRTKNMYFVLMS